jgi:C-terminal processing protease CtpA/Prc
VPIKYIAGKIYTNIHLDTIPVGSEILAINGASASKVIDVLSKYVSTDGYNTTGKYANIETDWMPFYMYLGFGENTTFKMRYRDMTSQSIQMVVLPAVSYDDFMKNYNQRHSKPYDNRYKADYQYEYIKDIHSGFLQVSTFAVGGQKSEGHKAYARFLETVFADLKKSKIQNLIVDIRGNGGGNDPNDLLLYAYLTQRNFRENTKAFTLFQEIPFPDYYIDDDIDELPLELKEEHRVLKNAKYYQHADFNKVWSPKENAFKGNIYLLIDPYVASAASLFASLVKSDSTTMVIGEESLGGYYGHTGHIPVNYELPNSKLVLTFSIVDLEQDVQKLPDQSYGDGVKPDWSVSQTYQDFITHRDTQLEYVIKMITTHNVL